MSMNKSRRNGGRLARLQKNQSDGDILATFRTSTVWQIEVKVLKRLMPGEAVSAEGLKNDLEEMD